MRAGARWAEQNCTAIFELGSRLAACGTGSSASIMVLPKASCRSAGTLLTLGNIVETGIEAVAD